MVYIGRDNRKPWRVPEDGARFRALTIGHPVVMGRLTYESLPRPLDGRLNVVITRDPGYDPPGCVVAHSLDQAVDVALQADDGEVFIGGGERVYREAMSLCERLYLTRIHGRYGGTVKFPDYSEFTRVVERRASADQNYRSEFLILER